MASTITRAQAKLIAEEVYKLMANDVKKQLNNKLDEIINTETEELVSLKEAAQLLRVSPGCLYKTKDNYGCYTKIKNRILFSKSRLIKIVQQGNFN